MYGWDLRDGFERTADVARGDMRVPEDYPLPEPLAAVRPMPDSRFFARGPSGRTQGGLFSLGGIHPTTVGYGLMAQVFINVMEHAGVGFYNRGGDPRKEPITVDWARVIALDTLVSHPAQSLSTDVALIGWLDERIDVLKRLWAGIA